MPSDTAEDAAVVATLEQVDVSAGSSQRRHRLGLAGCNILRVMRAVEDAATELAGPVIEPPVIEPVKIPSPGLDRLATERATVALTR